MYLWITYATVIVLVSFFLIRFGIKLIKDDEDYSVYIILPPTLIVVSIVFLIIGILIPNTSKVETDQTNLVSLRDSTNTSGTFYLFGGQVSKQPFYYFYKTNPNGSFSLDKAEALKSSVFEENRQDGQMITYYRVIVPTNHWSWNFTGKYLTAYEFHIPTGSISRQFILDTGE